MPEIHPLTPFCKVGHRTVFSEMQETGLAVSLGLLAKSNSIHFRAGLPVAFEGE